jgi:hypothetical protein
MTSIPSIKAGRTNERSGTPMSAHEIEQRLVAAQKRFDQASQALRADWQAKEEAQYWAAHDAVLVLERQLAAAKGEVPLDFPVKWDAGCPLPHLLCNDYKALLAFILREPKPGSDGSSVEMVSPADEKARPLALVEFNPCVAAKLGSPNDEVFDGHPLQGRGLDGYTAQKVVNSRWLAEIEAINKVHHCYNPASWRERNHYIFWFHDTTFECIAKSFTLEVYRESRSAMLARMCQRLLS